jgi:hypothetical protein
MVCSASRGRYTGTTHVIPRSSAPAWTCQCPKMDTPTQHPDLIPAMRLLDHLLPARGTRAGRPGSGGLAHTPVTTAVTRPLFMRVVPAAVPSAAFDARRHSPCGPSARRAPASSSWAAQGRDRPDRRARRPSRTRTHVRHRDDRTPKIVPRRGPSTVPCSFTSSSHPLSDPWMTSSSRSPLAGRRVPSSRPAEGGRTRDLQVRGVSNNSKRTRRRARGSYWTEPTARAVSPRFANARRRCRHGGSVTNGVTNGPHRRALACT